MYKNPSLEETKQFLKITFYDENGHGLKSMATRFTQKWFYKNDFSLYWNNILFHTSFIPDAKIGEKIYCLLNDIKSVQKCCVCNTTTKYEPCARRYPSYCSKKCMTNDQKTKDKRKHTMIELYGVEHNMQLESCIEARKLTYINNYGVDHPSKSEDIKLAKKNNYYIKYGIYHPSQNEDFHVKRLVTCRNLYGKKLEIITEKRIQTNNILYGVDHYSQTKEFIQKFQKTCLAKYGELHFSNDKEIRLKTKNTIINKYGVSYIIRSKESIMQAKYTRDITCLKLYGTKYPSQLTEFKIKSRINYLNNVRAKYGVDSPNQVPEIHEKSQKYRWKQYTMPSGKVINIQGYENFALDELLKTYQEDEITTQRKDIPEIWYFNETDNKTHRYFPDIWIEKDNLIIEVKSEWTMKKYYSINKLKEQAVLNAGYYFKFMIF